MVPEIAVRHHGGTGPLRNALFSVFNGGLNSFNIDTKYATLYFRTVVELCVDSCCEA